LNNQKEYCISVSNLSHCYSAVKAIDQISLNVNYGTIFGFLGPNGAGKTTTIKVLTTLIHPSSGSVKIFGKDIVEHSSEIRQKIGVVLQQPSAEVNLTVKQSLDLYGFLWDVPTQERKRRVDQLLEDFDLKSIENIKNDELSQGQRRRLQVAREFMHDMTLLFLDEPTVGLDVSSRRTLLDYIKLQVKEGLTVFFTTHIMEEAEYLCDEIAIINDGKIIALDQTQELKEKYGGMKGVEIKISRPVTFDVLSLIKSRVGNLVMEAADPEKMKIGPLEDTKEILKVLELLSEAGIEIKNIEITPPTLEEVFLKILDGHNNNNNNNKKSNEVYSGDPTANKVHS
jgi:ABC-2 type transport system ATP-binding protein